MTTTPPAPPRAGQQSCRAVGDALSWLAQSYRLDRTAGQDVSLYLAVEKAGLVIQVKSWFGDLGIPILALSGYGSQSYVKEVRVDIPDHRPAILIYAGDFDPSGEDIDRDFVARTGCWHKVIRVALTSAQVDHYQLPPALGKATDSRASAFVARHGKLVQVEVDALPPETLRDLFAAAIDQFWNPAAFDAVMAREDSDREQLGGLVG
jgi:hypothetical protein